MKSPSQIFFLLFFICTITDLIFITTGKDNLRFLTKPLLMPLLISGYYAELEKSGFFSKLFLGALFFSWMGDVVLMFDRVGELYFATGLVCFLIVHILYFRKAKPRGQSFFGKRPAINLVIAAYSFGLIYILWQGLGAMKIPVIIYASVISLMLVAAIGLYGKLGSGVARFFVAGAILFVASDSMLAFNKFKHAFPHAGSLIMLTYCTAQYLLLRGSVKHLRDEAGG